MIQKLIFLISLICNNLILTDSEFFAWYDLNHDLNLDILDIIILLNLILIDNN